MSKYPELFIESLKEGVRPATGCTEPIAVAYGAAVAMSYLENKMIEKIVVKVSPNVMKNAMAVIVPGTGEPGLLVAAAAGALAGDPTADLKVIAGLNEEELPAILALAHSGKVTMHVAPVEDALFVEVSISNGEETAEVYIAGGHTNIFLVKQNGEVVLSKTRPEPHSVPKTQQGLQEVAFKDVWDFAVNTDLEKIRFMKAAGDLNMALAEDGLKNEYGLQLGRSYDKAMNFNFGSGIEGDFSNRILAYTAAASDARMGGAQLPAMSNSGSGNQGITATVPVCVVADFVGASEEQQIRALTMSHLTALYAHAFLPVLSAFCAVDTAAMGSAAAIIYLMNEDREKAEDAIKNMAGDAPGMICDGAGCSCAMKVATAVSSMYRCVNLALQGIVIPKSNGMVCGCVDETLHGIGDLATNGMKLTDPVILKVMMDKAGVKA